MNNEHRKNNSSYGQGGARAPANHPRKDSQHYAHKNLLSQGSPSGRLENLRAQNHAGSSKGK